MFLNKNKYVLQFNFLFQIRKQILAGAKINGTTVPKDLLYGQGNASHLIPKVKILFEKRSIHTGTCLCLFTNGDI